jgi:hypothetical protein
MASASSDPAAIPQVIDVEGGAITLLDLGALRIAAEAKQDAADTAAQEASSLRSLADGLWIQVGKRLLASHDRWSAAPEAVAATQQAISIQEKLAADDSELESRHAKEQGGLGGLAFKVGGWSETRRLSNERTNLDSQLKSLLAQVAQLNPHVALPEIVPIRDQAVAAERQAHDVEQHAASLSIAAGTTHAEVKRRTDAESEMGFDAPYLAAYLKAYGPNEVESPVILKRAERAALVVAATLARNRTRRQWVGGSQGFSFPIGHTGIRYRVGSFHGHPVESQVLGQLDTGKLVITNQRIAFIGQSKSTSIPFAKLLHIECYSDAVSIFLEGRENPDFYLIPQPKYALFMINWFLNQAAK